MLVDCSSIEYRYFNERDFEIPLLCDLVERYRPNSLLDVGACYSADTYASKIRFLMEGKIYDGVDITLDKEVLSIVDSYFTSNVLSMADIKYDFVSCISVIEHCGMSTYKCDNVEAEQDAVARKVINLSRFNFLVTVPFGLPAIVPDQCSIITQSQIELWCQVAWENGFVVKLQYLYNKFSQGQEKWNTITALEANKIPFKLNKGVQSVCALLGAKR